MRWLHLLAMAFFVGEQVMLAAVVLPVGRRSVDRESLRLIARRFGYATLAALAVLIATGTGIAFHLELWSNGTFQLKLALVLVLGMLLAWHIRRTDLHVLEARSFSYCRWQSFGVGCISRMALLRAREKRSSTAMQEG